MSDKHKLKIAVNSDFPNAIYRRDFLWKQSISTFIQPDLSRKIFKDEAVISILHQAFECGLTRRDRWCLEGVATENKSAYIKSSQVFKRGVGLLDSCAASQSVASLPRKLRQDSYTVEVKDHVSDCFAGISADDVVIVDANVEKFWWHQIPTNSIAFEFSEANKNLETVAILIQMLQARVQIGAKVFVVGGGVAGDITGFVCGLLGLDVVYVPTTLLSMVDSSVGGKVGVNFEPWGKNQIGLFYPPRAVLIWTGWLTTLAESEQLSGMSEAIKHALIAGDQTMFNLLLDIAQTKNFSRIRQMILSILDVKAGIVANDPFENGQRAVLNFGHTLGHVLEVLAIQSKQIVPHGACIAIGMIHALQLSQTKFGGDFENIISSLRASPIVWSPSSLKRIFGGKEFLLQHKAEILRLLSGDKKAEHSSFVAYVLPQRDGRFLVGKNGLWTTEVGMDEAWLAIESTWKLVTENF